MFKSLFGVIGDVAKIATAPVEIALDVTRLVTKPAGNIAKTVTKEIKQTVEDLTS